MKILKSLFIGLFAVAITLTGCSKKTKGYTINGTINYDNDVDSVFIYEYGVSAVGKKLNKAPVVNNKFTLTGVIDVPQKVFYGNFDKNYGGELILENTNYNIDSENNTTKISGGEIHQKVLGYLNDPEYIKAIKDYNAKMNEIFKDVDMQDEKQLMEAREKANNIENGFIDYEEKIFSKILADKNENTLTKLFALISSQDWNALTREKRFELLDEYEKELGDHINIRIGRKYLNSESEFSEMKKSVANGKPYKEVVANDIEGKKIALSDLVKNNKYTILEFWASWCSPCRGEIPNLKKAYKKYKDLGLEIYSISIDSKKEDWEFALKEEQTTWPNALIVGKEESKQVEAYGVDGIPASFLIAQDGTIVASNYELREFELDKTLSKLFKKQ